MKLRIALEREDRGYSDPRTDLHYAYVFPEPDREMLVRAARPPPLDRDPADVFAWQQLQDRAKMVRENIAHSIAHSLLEALSKER